MESDREQRSLRLKSSYAENLKKARNTLTQRVQGPACEGSVEMNIKGLKDGNTAGFGVFEIPYAYIALRQSGGKRDLIMCNNDTVVQTLENIKQDQVWIRARATDKTFRVQFFYSLDGKQYHSFGNELQMGLGLPWTANRFALFNFSTERNGESGHVDFNWFHFTNK